QGLEVIAITNPRNPTYSGSLAVPCPETYA
ncbi:unnamed protein product, partial [marine sediment metagenome]